MAVTESFLVNTNSFNPIIEALIERDEAPEKVTDELFASMGFEGPSELLVIHMLKELNMLTVEGEPTELYHDLTNSDTTDEALATGIIHAYSDLFTENREFYKLQQEDVRAALENYFEGRKTDLILKYMTNTFHKLVSYAGLSTMQKAVNKYFENKAEVEEVADSEDVIEETADTPSAEEAVADSVETGEESADAESAEGVREVIAETEETEETPKPLEDEMEVSESETEDDFNDDEVDDIFFGEESDKQDEETELEEVADEISAAEEEKEGINFDELPQVQREEKGSESIDEFLNIDNNTEETEEATASSDAESETEVETTATDEEESLSEKQKETLEKELMEIDMESTNGLHKNGTDNAEIPMTNLNNLPTKEKVEKALIKKAELLYKLERFEDVLPAYKDVISYFDDSDKEHLQEAVAKAVINQVSVLKKLNREDELLPALNEVINRFEDSSVNEYYEHASLAMLDKAQLLKDESPETLLPLFNDIIDRLRRATAPKVKTQVDDIFVKRVDVLTETGPEQKLLDAVDDLISRFEGSQTHTGQLEQAMYKKAEVLENLGRDEEALEAYSEFLEMFGKSKEMV